MYFCELFIFLEVRVVLLKYKGLKNDIFERVKFNLVYVLDIVLVFLICCIDILIFIWWIGCIINWWFCCFWLVVFKYFVYEFK